MALTLINTLHPDFKLGLTFVYGLVDPNTHLVQFIGSTCTGLSRPRVHGTAYYLSTCTNHPKNQWIQALKAQNQTYLVSILQQAPAKDLPGLEQYWISYYKGLGQAEFNAGAGTYQTPNPVRIEPTGPSTALKTALPGPIAPVPAQIPPVQTVMSADLAQLTTEQLNKIQKSHARAIKAGRLKPFKDQHGNIYQTIIEAVYRLGLKNKRSRWHVFGVLSGRNASIKGFRLKYLNGSTPEYGPYDCHKKILTNNGAWKTHRPACVDRKHKFYKPFMAWRASTGFKAVYNTTGKACQGLKFTCPTAYRRVWDVLNGFQGSYKGYRFKYATPTEIATGKYDFDSFEPTNPWRAWKGTLTKAQARAKKRAYKERTLKKQRERARLKREAAKCQQQPE